MPMNSSPTGVSLKVHHQLRSLNPEHLHKQLVPQALAAAVHIAVKPRQTSTQHSGSASTPPKGEPQSIFICSTTQRSDDNLLQSQHSGLTLWELWLSQSFSHGVTAMPALEWCTFVGQTPKVSFVHSGRSSSFESRDEFSMTKKATDSK
jgi:hypothetical protein